MRGGRQGSEASTKMLDRCHRVVTAYPAAAVRMCTLLLGAKLTVKPLLPFRVMLRGPRFLTSTYQAVPLILV